jgi:hypothetical protein
MKLRAILVGLGITAVSGVVGYSQRCHDELHATFLNLDFAEGNPGDRPPGWEPPPCVYLPPRGNYTTEIASGADCHSGKQCAVVRSLRPDPIDQRWFLFQRVDVTPYRGKELTFRAAVRAEVALGSVARLLVRVHGKNVSTLFFDDMGRFPITSSAWGFYEMHAPIAEGAEDVEFGMQLIGFGAAWIDNISMNFADDGK